MPQQTNCCCDGIPKVRPQVFFNRSVTGKNYLCGGFCPALIASYTPHNVCFSRITLGSRLPIAATVAALQACLADSNSVLPDATPTRATVGLNDMEALQYMFRSLPCLGFWSGPFDNSEQSTPNNFFAASVHLEKACRLFFLSLHTL